MAHDPWSWKKADLPQDVLETLLARFQMGLFEAALQTDPESLTVLTALGELYTRQGLYEKGLGIDKRLVSLRPEEPTFHYNLACSHSLLGNLDTAFTSLERAVQLGYSEVDHLRRDPDLRGLRQDSRWRALIEQLQAKKVRG